MTATAGTTEAPGEIAVSEGTGSQGGTGSHEGTGRLEATRSQGGTGSHEGTGTTAGGAGATKRSERAARHLVSISDLDREDMLGIFHLADAFKEVSERAIPRVPALRGKTVATLFFEPSTRTRLSFEAAAKRLSADVMSFSASTSSLEKGESLRDTIETIDAMGVDAMIVRHKSSGVPSQVRAFTRASVINGGDGQHEHPTQALLDCYTIREALQDRTPPSASGPVDLSGVRIAVVGDIRHSRVARSDVIAMTALGAEVVLVAPRTLLPPSMEGWPVKVTADLDGVLGSLDVVYLLRIQRERAQGGLLPSLDEYHRRFGLTRERAARLDERVLVMHPGPMNRGVEIAPEAADMPSSLITRQVRNGVLIRMAVLFHLLGSGWPLVPGDEPVSEAAPTAVPADV
ncbi:MAG: aspartate carbamoyltransferase catalytic subunit [Actinomycetota bacterium]|nr:aspartate carbamoyltransferase catalytic subunit [Actinomycetota bacterium]